MRFRAVSMALLVLLVMSGCTDDAGDGASASSTLAPATSQPIVVTSSSTTSPSSTATTLLPTTTTTIADPAKLPRCTPNMGPTVMAEGIFSGPGSEGVPNANLPDGRPPQVDFDWNLDGEPDRLVLDAPNGTIVVDWGSGSIQVSDVTTAFDMVITMPDGYEYVLQPQTAATVSPAGVADVTGDGLLDLVVISMGAVGVLAGSGTASSSIATSFARLGVDQPGWRNDPVNAIDARDSKGRSQILPTPISSVEFVGDVTKDGVGDFAAVTEYDRSSGPLVFYAGRPCTNA